MGSIDVSYAMNGFTQWPPPSTSQSADPPRSGQDAVREVEDGYPFREFETLAVDLGVTQQRLSSVLRISSSTLARRRGGRMTTLESGRIYRLRQLWSTAKRVIGDAADARRWLSTLNDNLGTVPLDLASTEPGLDLLLRYLWQVDEGVFL